GVVDQVGRGVLAVVAGGGGDGGAVGGGGEVRLEGHRLGGGGTSSDLDPGDRARAPAGRLEGHVVGAGNHVDRRGPAAPGGDGGRGDARLVVADEDVDAGHAVAGRVRRGDGQAPVVVGVGAGEAGVRVGVGAADAAGPGA